MILKGHELAEYKELEDVIIKCFQNMQGENLSYMKAKLVLKYLDRLVDENSLLK